MRDTVRIAKKPRGWPLRPKILSETERVSLGKLRDLRDEFSETPKSDENVNHLSGIAREALGIALNGKALIETRRKALMLLAEVFSSSPPFADSFYEEITKGLKRVRSAHLRNEVTRTFRCIEKNRGKKESQKRLDDFRA